MSLFNQHISFVVQGNPIAKQRHRSRTNKGQSFATNYNPSEKDELNFLYKAKMVLGSITPISGPIKIDCTYYFKRPRSHMATGKNKGGVRGSAPKYHTITPDIDNLDKFLFDALNGYLWVDDKQIVESCSRKLYSENENGRSEIDIYYQKQEDE